MKTPHSDHIDTLLARIRGEYLEMPGLRLSAAQAGRLWGLEAARCDALLAALVDNGFLRRWPDGTFARASADLSAGPMLRMARAGRDRALARRRAI
jgi:hypothetical protein